MANNTVWVTQMARLRAALRGLLQGACLVGMSACSNDALEPLSQQEGTVAAGGQSQASTTPALDFTSSSALSKTSDGALILPLPSQSSLMQAGPLTSFNAPIEIDGATASAECDYFGEGYPTRSHNATIGDARWDLPYQLVYPPTTLPAGSAYNWSTNWNTWSTQSALPQSIQNGGDAWSTTSSYTGLEYVSKVGVSGGNQCLGVATTTWAHLQTGSWDIPLTCATPTRAFPDGDDGPSIYYDDTTGGHNLLGASTGTYEHLYIWPSCDSNPVPDCQEACGLCTNVNIKDSSGQLLTGGHPTVRAHNNHDAMVAFQSGTNIHLITYTPTGTWIKDYIVASAVTFDAVSACKQPYCIAGNDHGTVPKAPASGAVHSCNVDDCSGPLNAGAGGCMRIANKVQLATRYTGGHQYAYLTYNYLCPTAGPDGGLHMKVRLNIEDVTNPTAPIHIATHQSDDCNSNANDYSPIFLAAENYDKFAWGFYRQLNGSGADTRLEVAATISPTVASWSGVWYVDSGFPTLIVDNQQTPHFDYGLGDYIGGADDTSGNLFFTYGRPVVTTATTCPSPMNTPTSCQGNTYSVALYGVKVTP